MEPIVAVLFLAVFGCGALVLGGALFNWDRYWNTPSNRLLSARLGRKRARILHGGLGGAIMAYAVFLFVVALRS